jgi:hypothetical protein
VLSILAINLTNELLSVICVLSLSVLFEVLVTIFIDHTHASSCLCLLVRDFLLLTDADYSEFISFIRWSFARFRCDRVDVVDEYTRSEFALLLDRGFILFLQLEEVVALHKAIRGDYTETAIVLVECKV